MPQYRRLPLSRLMYIGARVGQSFDTLSTGQIIKLFRMAGTDGFDYNGTEKTTARAYYEVLQRAAENA